MANPGGAAMRKGSAPFRLPERLTRIFYGWWIVLACFIISIVTGAVTFFGFTAFFDPLEIGRASWRERVYIWVGAG